MSIEQQGLQNSERVCTCCVGLDNVLGGGLPIGHFYLIAGDPGAGKTTLALQFCIDGLQKGERVLYVTLSESEADLRLAADSHNFSLDGLEIIELLPDENDLNQESQYSVFHPAEVELHDRMRTILDHVDRLKPQRLVIDALSELRMLARDQLRYRRQILSMKSYLARRGCTVLLLDDQTSGAEIDSQLQSIAHGVIALHKLEREYGPIRRRLHVLKLRGTPFREGYHDYVIRTGGVIVFPRLIAAESRGPSSRGVLPSGISALDSLTGAGLERGTSTLIMGPAGSGKTTIATCWMMSAVERGENGAFFIFEEGPQTLIERASGLGMNMQPHIDSGKLALERFDPAEISPGEFVARVCHHVEERGARIIIVDSLNGYLHSMPGEDFLPVHLHELLTYLNNRGVVTIMVLAQTGMIGSSMPTPVDVSYLADNVLLLRYFEARGEMRQAISAVKKRSGGHERNIRELRLADGAIRIGDPLTGFHGVLTGVPQFIDSGTKS